MSAVARGRQRDLSTFWQELVECGGELSCLLRLITRQTADVVGEASVLAVVSADGTTLEPVASYHADPQMAAFIDEILGSTSFPVGEGVAGRVAAERQPAIVHGIAPDVIAEIVQPQTRVFAELHPIRALLVVPMIANGELVGTLGVVRTESVAPYEQDDVVAVEALAERAAYAIADARRQPATLGPEEYEAIYHHSIDGVMFTVPDGRILAANRAACEILGLSEAEICSRGRGGLLMPDDPATTDAVAERARTGRVRAEVPMRRGSGEVFTAEISSSIFTTTAGEVRACVVFRDVTEQAARRDYLEHYARMLEDRSERDPLTNLRNRRGFLPAAEEALAIAGREHKRIQLLYFDLDHLKRINDTEGHPAGDALIRRFASTLAAETRDADVSARLGGDEFVLLLFSASEDDADRIVERIAKSFDRSGNGPRGSFSVGVAEWSGEPESLDRLVERADHQMYEAKVRRRFTRKH